MDDSRIVNNYFIRINPNAVGVKAGRTIGHTYIQAYQATARMTARDMLCMYMSVEMNI